MIGMVMIALGVFRFGASGASYQNMRRSTSYRWESVERIGRRPALQFSGIGTEEVTLDGVIYPHFKGGLRQVDLMRLQAGRGAPMIMVDGMGWVWERWVITRVEEGKSLFLERVAFIRIHATRSVFCCRMSNSLEPVPTSKRHALADGAPRRIDFALTLQAYGGDRA